MKKRLLISMSLMTFLQAGSLPNTTPMSEPISIKSINYLNNFYLGVGYTQFKTFTPIEHLHANSATLIAGYHINDYLSVETRYTKSIEDLSYKSTIKTTDIDSTYSNLAIFTKFSYQIDDFKPYLLLGYGKNRITKLANITRIENSIEYGTGLEYKLNSNFSINLDYIRAYNKKGFDGRARNQKVKINLITASITYNF